MANSQLSPTSEFTISRTKTELITVVITPENTAKHASRRNHRGGPMMSDEATPQIDRGQKRSNDETLDGNGPVQDEKPFNIESVTQVNIKKFRTTGYELSYPLHQCACRR